MALSGILGNELIPPQAICGIPEGGGVATARLDTIKYKDFVSIGRAAGVATGRVQDNGWVSALQLTVDDCNILDVLTAERIVLGIQSRYPEKGNAPIRSAVGSRFENLKIAGAPVRIEIDTELGTNGRSRRIPGSLVTRLVSVSKEQSLTNSIDRHLPVQARAR
jgi:hypothetical protein